MATPYTFLGQTECVHQPPPFLGCVLQSGYRLDTTETEVPPLCVVILLCSGPTLVQHPLPTSRCAARVGLGDEHTSNENPEQSFFECRPSQKASTRRNRYRWGFNRLLLVRSSATFTPLLSSTSFNDTYSKSSEATAMEEPTLLKCGGSCLSLSQIGPLEANPDIGGIGVSHTKRRSIGGSRTPRLIKTPPGSHWLRGHRMACRGLGRDTLHFVL